MGVTGSSRALGHVAAERADAGWQLSLLDGFCLRGAAGIVTPPLSAQRLLALLGVRGPTTRAVASGTLWGDASDQHALGCLRTTLWRLAPLGPLALSDGEILRLSGQVRVDIEELRAWAARSIRVAGRGGSPEPDYPVTVRSGELLPGWYDDWVVDERERLAHLQLHGLEAVATSLCRAGRYAEAIDASLVAIGIEPLRESAHRVLVATHLAEGNVVEAMRHYAKFRDRLWAEVRVRPSAVFETLLDTGTTSCGRPGGPRTGAP